MALASEQIKEIDISRAAWLLRFLRMTDYVLIILCGYGLFGIVQLLFLESSLDDIGSLVLLLLAAAVLSFAIYTGYRHVGVIDPRVWRAYLFLFPMLLLLAGASLWGLAMTPGSLDLDDPTTFTSIMVLPWVTAVAILGFFSVFFLRRMRLPEIGIPLVGLLYMLHRYMGVTAVKATSIPRANAPKGTAFAIFGGLLLLLIALIPNEFAVRHGTVFQHLGLVAFFLLIRARRYFQASADSLLSVDKRNPILFLRSFYDDEKQDTTARKGHF